MFKVIGERINTTRKNVQKAVAERDANYIVNDVKAQEDAGADYIDVNAGAVVGAEKESMKWLIDTIQTAVSIPLCLDSADPEVLEMAYGLADKKPIINSISLENERYKIMMPFLKGKNCGILALCLDDKGMPKDSDDVFDRAERLVTGLQGIGFIQEDIYVDPLVQPVGMEPTNGLMAMESAAKIRKAFPDINLTCGLSNISFGLPERKKINRVFLSLMMGMGLNSAIIDPLDVEMMSVLRTTEMLLGNDEYCVNFLKAYRAGLI